MGNTVEGPDMDSFKSSPKNASFPRAKSFDFRISIFEFNELLTPGFPLEA
jgi:hypothetical protein